LNFCHLFSKRDHGFLTIGNFATGQLELAFLNVSNLVGIKGFVRGNQRLHLQFDHRFQFWMAFVMLTQGLQSIGFLRASFLIGSEHFGIIFDHESAYSGFLLHHRCHQVLSGRVDRVDIRNDFLNSFLHCGCMPQRKNAENNNPEKKGTKAECEFMRCLEVTD